MRLGHEPGEIDGVSAQNGFGRLPVARVVGACVQQIRAADNQANDDERGERRDPHAHPRIVHPTATTSTNPRACHSFRATLVTVAPVLRPHAATQGTFGVGMLRPVIVSACMRIHWVLGPGAHGPSGSEASRMTSEWPVTSCSVPVTSTLQPRW